MPNITWDSTKGNATLSNGNLTAIVYTNSFSTMSTIGRNKGKWYVELNVDITSASGTMFGISTLDRSKYLAIYNYNGTLYPGAAAYTTAFSSGTMLGIAIDFDSYPKRAKFFKNGQDLGFRDIVCGADDILYLYLTSGSSSNNNNTFTINFGASAFNLVTSNSNAWNQLIDEGFLPYNYGIGMVSTFDKSFINSNKDTISNKILDIPIDTTYIHSSNISAKVLGYNELIAKVNDTEILRIPKVNSFPKTNILNFSNVNLSNENDIIFSADDTTIGKYKLYYEGDGLLNPITRDFKNTDWVDKSNVALNPGTGISLTNLNRQGSVFTDVSVYRKSEVKKVTVDGDNDKVITGNFVFKPNFLDTYFYKNVITRPLGSRFTVMNYQFSDILYMKECVELPGNTTMTDNNDTTATGMIANSTRTWLLASAEILSLYVKPRDSVRIDIYNSLNTIIYTNTITTATTMTINKSDICKIVITNTYGAGINLFTVSAIGGYDSKKFHLYSNPKYNIYSPVNASVSKLVLEDIISPTKDLVKSKKMGNLAFINNPSKVIVKKTSASSNQTSSKIVRNKIDLANIPMRKIEVK